MLKINKKSESLLDHTKYWQSPTPPFSVSKKKPNTNLRMACLVGNRLFEGLRYEGNVILITPTNWRYVLKYAKPDFLLVESMWQSVTGHWHMGLYPSSADRNVLSKIIHLSKKLSIPTVFWATKGHEYHYYHKDFATSFDAVFCSDIKDAEIFQKEGIACEVLLPCVQPAIYNPFRSYDYHDTFGLEFLYDGLADIDRLPEKLNVLRDIKKYGLMMVESRYHIFHNRLNLLSDFKNCIAGCISKKSRIVAMKYAKSYLTFDHTLSTRTSQQWMTLEAVSSRLNVIHHGRLYKDDVCKNIVTERPDVLDLKIEVVRCKEDDLYRERKAHLGWRKANQHHTFAHRVKDICDKIGVKNDWIEFPKVSLITPTIRDERLPLCIDTFHRQTYPNKELIVVINSNKKSKSISQEDVVNISDEVKIAYVPAEIFAGACLNRGNSIASGDYVFRIDDDDYYGPNYILDMILQAKCIGATLFGKPPSSKKFNSEPNIYYKNSNPSLCVTDLTTVASGKIRFGGNSISGKSHFFKSNLYDDLSYGSADTSFLYNLANNNSNDIIVGIMDKFNIIGIRNSDKNFHTWKIDERSLKIDSEVYSSIEDLII